LFQFAGFYLYLKLGGNASEISNISHAGYLLKPGNNHPFVQFGKFPQIVILAFYDITVNFANG